MTRAATCLLLAIGLPGCGGALDTAPPAVAVAFPPPFGRTEAALLPVVVRAEDDFGVASVRVGGLPAAPLGGAWRAFVPLPPGPAVLDVEAVDRARNRVVAPGAVRTTRLGSWIVAPRVLAIEPGGALYLADGALDRVTGLARDGSDLRVVARDGIGEPAGLAWRASVGDLLVLDAVGGVLSALDPASGVARVVSGPGRGAGPSLVSAAGLALDDARGVAWTRTRFPERIVAIDLAGGDRSQAAGAGDGLEPALDGMRALAFDPARARLLVAVPGAVLALDPADGARAVLADGLVAPRALAVDGADVWALDRGALERLAPVRGTRVADGLAGATDLASDGGTLFLLDASDDRVVRVDGDPGTPTTVARTGVGDGPPLANPRDAEFDPGTGLLWVVDATRGLVRIDPEDGARVVPGGGGPALALPVAIARRDDTGTLLLVDSALGALLAADPSDGSTAVLSSAAVGSGVPVGLWTDVAWDARRGRALVLDTERGGVVSVDPAGGARADVPLGGVALRTPRAIAVDAASDRLLVLDAGSAALVAFDRATGQRTLLSGSGRGTGPGPVEPARMALDPAGGRVLLADRGRRGILAFDLVTGARVLLDGGGDPLAAPQAVVPGLPGGLWAVVDSALGAVLALEPGTGARLVVSR